MPNGNSHNSRLLREVFHTTRILRKPISGIVSGYHEVPYILVAPEEKNPLNAVEVNGTVQVSPKLIISSQMLSETFGEVFDPSTFDEDIKGRIFSFAVSRKRNVRIESKKFSIRNHEEPAEERLNRIHDLLMQQENVRTALVYGPKFAYYPVSIDRLINEILDREFNV